MYKGFVFNGVLTLFAVVWSVRCDSCHLRELDLCSASVAGMKGVPVNEEEVDKFCGYANEAFECFTSYTDKCMTPLQKELVAYAMGDGHKATADKFCTHGNDLRTNYLKQAPCLAKAHTAGKSCAVDGQVALEKIEEAAFQDKVTVACCAYARFKKCTEDTVQKTCGEEAVQYGKQMVHMLTSNLVDVVCQGFETNPRCSTLLPPPGTQPKNNGKSLISKMIGTYLKS